MNIHMFHYSQEEDTYDLMEFEPQNVSKLFAGVHSNIYFMLFSMLLFAIVHEL